MSALDTQVGGEHYKTLGQYQPFEVLKAWLTPEEFRGWVKGNAIVYLARERQKNGLEDIQKCVHTLDLGLERGMELGTATQPAEELLGEAIRRLEHPADVG